MTNPARSAGPGLGVAGGIGVLAVVCCAGPALVAAGVLGAAGRLLGNPIVIAVALAVALLGITAAVRRRGRDECCPPARGPSTVRERPDQEVR